MIGLLKANQSSSFDLHSHVWMFKGAEGGSWVRRFEPEPPAPVAMKRSESGDVRKEDNDGAEDRKDVKRARRS